MFCVKQKAAYEFRMSDWSSDVGSADLDFPVHDYVGGFEDVQNKVLRLIGDPETRYHEAPARMLRVVRFAAQLGFSIDEATAAPVPALAPLLADAAPARLFEECLKLFLSGYAEQRFLGRARFGRQALLFPLSAAGLNS